MKQRIRDGQQCPECGSHETSVTDSRPANGIKSNYRRRKCKACKNTWRTVEIEEAELVVYYRLAKLATKAGLTL